MQTCQQQKYSFILFMLQLLHFSIIIYLSVKTEGWKKENEINTILQGLVSLLNILEFLVFCLFTNKVLMFKLSV